MRDNPDVYHCGPGGTRPAVSAKRFPLDMVRPGCDCITIWIMAIAIEYTPLAVALFLQK